MFKAWTASDEDSRELARQLEGHLNEYAEVVISVGYSVEAGRHYVFAVYTPVEAVGEDDLEAAVSMAEEIVEEAQTGEH